MPGKKKTSSGDRSARGAPAGIPIDELVRRLKPVLEQLKADRHAPLLPALAGVNLAHPWILRSTQHLRIKNFIRWLEEGAFPEKGSVRTFFGTDLSSSQKIGELCRMIATPSLFHPRQVAVIYDADSLKAAAVKPIADALSAGAPAALVIFAVERDKKGALGELPAGTSVVFDELSEAQLDRWIEKEAERNGAGVQPDAARLLAAHLGKDLARLSTEVARLASLAPSGGAISAELVREQSAAELHEESFRLVHALLRGDPVQSTLIGKRLRRQGFHPLQLSAFLSRSLRVLCAAKDNPSHSALHSDLSNFFFIRNLSPLLSTVEKPGLVRALRIVGDLDRELKSSAFDESTALDRALARIARANSRSRIPAPERRI